MTAISYWLLFLFLLALSWLARAWLRCSHPPPAAAVAARVPWLLKPRSPDDCPACREQHTRPLADSAAHPRVRPWCKVKSRRGAPKRIGTAGFACPTRTCSYYRITDAHVHALVADGTHGKRERIQTFRCQACKTTFSARRHTPLYQLKTPAQRVSEVLTALAEGLDVAAATRVFGHSEGTIMRWLQCAGTHSTMVHQRWFYHFHLSHLQLDELRTRLRHRAHTLWLWVALDPVTKLIPVLYLGPRTQDAAHTVIHQLCHRLAPGCLPVFTSDGLRLYFYALTAHFGQWVVITGRRRHQWQVAPDLIYGQVKKIYRGRRLARVIYVMRCGTLADLQAALRGLGLSGCLNTAFVERINLTMRQSVSALTRRTWSTAQGAPQLLAHVEWWRAYYHFARPHTSLRVALAQPIGRGGRREPQRYRQRTPAMAAGLTRRRWTVRELLALPLPPTPRSAG